MKKRILLPMLLIAMLLLLFVSCNEDEETVIVFDIGNGETETYTVTEFSELEIPDDPKREGYVFDGWYFDNAYTEAFTLTALSSKEKGGTITVYSKWTAHTDLEFKYEFYLDGGKIGEETVKGMNPPKTESASKSGYVFIGWYLDDRFENEFSKDKITPDGASGVTKLYAKMMALADCEFNIHFTVDGALYSKILTTGTSFTYPASPEKFGYAFGGWYLDESFENSFTADDLASCSVSEPVVVYAKFIKLTAVNFYIDETLYATKYTHDGQITLPETPEKDGYTFGGWYLDGEYKTVFNKDVLASLLPSESISVYAKFIKVSESEGYSVTFYVDGSIYATKYTSGGKVTLPAPPEKEHMTFRGWYYDIAFKYQFSDSEYISENKSLYARFENKEIIATLKNGDDVDSVKIYYGESYTLPKYSLDTENKRRFLGWAVEGSDALITDNKGNSLSVSEFDDNVTLTAVWDSYLYRLGLYSEGNVKEYFLKSGKLDFTVSDPVSKKWYLAFEGWYTDDNPPKKVDLNNHVFTEDLYLTAKFVCAEIPLIWDYDTQFSFIFASGFSTNGVTYDAICEFIGTEIYRRFPTPSIDVEHPGNAPSASDYEILLGPDALYRGDECCVSSRELGKDGYVIKVVGNTIVIAGGSDEATKEAFLKFLEDFVSFEEGEDRYVETRLIAKKDAYAEKKTEYPIEKITVSGYDLREFNVCAYCDGDNVEIAEKLRDIIYESSGYYLDVTETNISGSCSCEHHILIGAPYNSEKDTNGDGFVVYVEDGKMVIACLYPMLFEETVMDFAGEYITGKTGSVSFDNGFVYTKNVNAVSYEDFGAVGDGVTDDFEAIYNTHIFANQTGQKVLGKAGAKYYIGDTFTKTIPVKTSVDFCGATIIINDVGNVAFENSSIELFTVSGDCQRIDGSELSGENTISKGDTAIPWLSGYSNLFGGDVALVRVVNNNIIYNAYVGSSNNSNAGGVYQSETFMVDREGNILNGSAAYTYDTIKYVDIFKYSAKEQIIENCNFKTIRALRDNVISGCYGTEVYHRGISMSYKNNLTLENITYELLNQPPYSKTGSPTFEYDPFISMSYCYGMTIKNSKIDPHPEYMGYVNVVEHMTSLTTYSVRISSCDGVTIDGLTLYNDGKMTDTKYIQLLKVVNTKNLTVKNSNINGIEIVGLLGGRFEKSTIGRVIEMVGGGDLVFDEVVRIANKSFIQLTLKYGAYFNGDITFKNCEMKGEKAYNSNNGETGSTGNFANLYLVTSMYKAQDQTYASWDYFMGELTMPYTVTVDGGVKIRANAKLHVFQDIADAAFDPSYSDDGETAYVVTKKIIFKNMTPITITNGTGEILNSIPVEIEE